MECLVYLSSLIRLASDSLQLADQAQVLTQSIVAAPKERKFSPISDGSTVKIENLFYFYFRIYVSRLGCYSTDRVAR